MFLKQLTSFFRQRQNANALGTTVSSFTALTPVDNADSDGCYTKALSFAFDNPRIRNIALSGPHGSGKTSIIRTYEKNTSQEFLHISLACFKDQREAAVDTASIEKSILQQMLYSVDPSRLPYSRFKRISTPKHPVLKSFIVALWSLIAIALYRHKDQLFTFENLRRSWSDETSIQSIGLYVTAVLWIVVFVILLSRIYKASFDVSLKKISLKNVEIEGGDVSEKSILNRHLDEIIYFFQATNYRAVVIEDIDRFDDPEIFVTLREINKLINDNENSSGQLKFIYAIKDDMFAHQNRAKFFDFIIPVIPIINSYNSLDMMQQRIRQHAFAKAVNEQFLREVSLYLADLRLIHNIFNEFVIYYDRLNSNSLDLTKLLAIIIYKNVYSSDFEDLHHGKGALISICNKKSAYILQEKERLEDELKKIRHSVERATSEQFRSLQELINSYVGHIVIHAGQPVAAVYIKNQNITLAQIASWENFQTLFSESNITLVMQNPYQSQRFSINKSFSDIEGEVNPSATFLERKKDIENNVVERRLELQRSIEKIEKEISELPHLKLSSLLLENAVEIDEMLDEIQVDNRALFLYLLRNGWVDDTYNLYISNFHEGRLTRNDRDYILTVRNFARPDPNQIIDTPKEVCANLREEDFRREYVLNVTLVDYLIENSTTNAVRIKSAMNYIATNFAQAQEFLSAYLVSGGHLDLLIKSLSNEWPGLAAAATVAGKNGPEIVLNILTYVDVNYICNHMNNDNVISNYLAKNGALILASNLPGLSNYDVLAKLDVRFHNLSSLGGNQTLIEFVHSQSLYSINATNVDFILRTFADEQSVGRNQPETANYTSILNVGSESLKKNIDKNLQVYVEKVLLALPNNTEETETTIRSLINNDSIEVDVRKKILTKQNQVFQDFEGIPEFLWQHLLTEEKVVLNWKNVSAYLQSADVDKSFLTQFLSRPTVVDSLLAAKFGIDDVGRECALALAGFVLNNFEVADSDYCRLVKCLPFCYKAFPEKISRTKMECLSRERKVVLTEQSFALVVEDAEIAAVLVEKSIGTYEADKEKYPLNDEIREFLLASDLSNEQKFGICRDVSPTSATASKSLSRKIAGVMLSGEFDYALVNNDVLSSAIINAQTIKDSIRLFDKCLKTWDSEQTMRVLSLLPVPFNEISIYGKRPRLPHSDVNLAFATQLANKGFISSINEDDESIRINTFKSRNL